jgi:carboxyl-terminal processing protease
MTGKHWKTHIVLIAVVLISSFLTGFTYRDLQAGSGIARMVAGLQVLPQVASTAAIGAGNNGVNLPPVDTYSNVISYVGTHYYGEKPKPKQLTYAAIRGMMGSLGDRYTRFMDPTEHKEMSEENRGDFEGIGAELDTKDGRIFIRKVLPNSPALRAQLKAKDTILKVGDKLIQGMDITDVVKLIRGPGGTKVKLSIKREDTPEPFDVEITRDVIQFEIVESRMEDTVNKIGYIALHQFNEKSDDQVYAAMNDLDNQGAKAFVLDLRGNPGGLLDSAISIGSRFISNGDIVVIQNKGGHRSAVPVDDSKHNNPMHPLAVLIDGNTASAAEIVSGAIQDNKAGVLIGKDSFGKGLVQTIIELDDGSAVAITTAKYLTPNGHEVTPTQKIKPDIAIEPTDDDVKNENDVQLKRAVQYLKERMGVGQTTADAKDHGKS